MTGRKSFLRQFFTLWGLGALMALAACAFAVTVAHIDSAKARRLAEEGADAQAKVTGLTMTSTRTDNRTRHHFEVTFTFTVDGTAHEVKRIVSESLYRSLRTGDQIPVRYWTADPTLAEIEPGFHAGQAMIGQIVAGVAGVLALIFAALGWRWASAARWMARNGVAREVKVTRLAGFGALFGSAPYYRVVWQDDQGEGRSRPHRIKLLPGAGTTTTILTDPAGRRRSLWEGDL